ncbi:glutathione S-transferase [Aliiroseovarius zhejiangensis]|uniref:Glutathione S-transferase n=1 Tax=Aliiroseovarius zhejiangensis TaxID=1632025 RepID=A0ABQ3ILL7_9RHOB|nr:glutathione S-transferase N-terminal domain-containing protein [Aliiroseovarius zhejiangensis]GHE87405.1 glutathione S-transferase [Aliiroseovarius zhejiangensis]
MLDQFDITKRWPAKDASVIQLYSLPTPNGIKVSAMLEETGLPYEAHLVSFAADDQHTPEFLSLNPNNKIPAIIDPNGPNGAPLPLWESGAILIYLAEKSGKLLPSDAAKRAEVLQWLMWQMGGFGPMLGQFGFFYAYGGKEIEDPRPLDRYKAEAKRLLSVLDQRLDGRSVVAGDAYSIADIAIWPWVRALFTGYKASEVLGLEKYANVLRWHTECADRPASQAAVNIPASPE